MKYLVKLLSSTRMEGKERPHLYIISNASADKISREIKKARRIFEHNSMMDDFNVIKRRCALTGDPHAFEKFCFIKEHNVSDLRDWVKYLTFIGIKVEILELSNSVIV